MHVHFSGAKEDCEQSLFASKICVRAWYANVRAEKPQATSCLVSTQLAAHSFVARALTYYTLTDFLAKERLLPVIYTVL